ncbi:homoserine O-acetyltransferase/O-succinyltransferase family protein [Clostridium manihotivorum]|uniref:Homoserine O-acetyltransferase n=1 Tax=Clostridium manihotivorum TaxID=2320868 RepID=A0A3R5X4B9_9CLOT|nr:homoserine O-succinyltransferase [Clostridium manihotivorum]QAA34297.1 homoserine O-succinyltransferase [Clostridium manihotivorum]
MTIYCGKKIVGADLMRYNPNICVDIADENLPKIGILNLMPNKYDTEKQLLELLSRTKLDLEVNFIRLLTHSSKSVPNEYLEENYEFFDEVKEDIDCLIVTGAPVEKLEFNQVSYIDELNKIMDYMKSKGKKSVFICWGAQAALNHYYGIRKELCEEKVFGIFKHKKLEECLLLEGISDNFYAPHSRHTRLRSEDIRRYSALTTLAYSEGAGEYIIVDDNSLYILGHCEYHKETLKNEYFRDLNKGLSINIPKNYFVNDDPYNDIIESWQEDGVKLYENWLRRSLKLQ